MRVRCAEKEKTKRLEHQKHQLNSNFLIGSVSYKAIQTIYDNFTFISSAVSFNMCENLIPNMQLV